MLAWKAHFFELGFSLQYIENMNYDDYEELIEGFSYKNKSSSRGKNYFATSDGELCDTHKQMIKNRKKLHGEK